MRLLLTGLALALSALAHAQTYPTKTVRFISGVTPGSASDTMARILAEKLSASLGQPVIVENRLGAGGLVGAKWVRPPRSPTATTHDVRLGVHGVDTSQHGARSEGAGAGCHGRHDYRRSSSRRPEDTNPRKTLSPRPKRSRASSSARPRASVARRTWRSSASAFAAGFEVLNVHTKGAGEALTEVVSGRADCYFALVFQAQKMKDSGKVNTFLVSGPKRTSLMPSLPTTEEAGYPGSSYNFSVGTLVAAKTPRPIVERLAKEINTLVQIARDQRSHHQARRRSMSLTIASSTQ